MHDALCRIKSEEYKLKYFFICISAHTASRLPVSNQFDRRAAAPENMQSALSLYKASAALANTQVLSCSAWKKGFQSDARAGKS